ncbi:methyl-accepting chemotaxis protein [Clostridium muellerianum]|uniref:methyl-accepting chemotaxis protein n=1 Tax=Clostridium muellerianum TaxID=2716538 RepID=UPI00197E82DD|nr:methyl-accepting chemotaxis protein [Clostridium muellerianum]
MEIKSKVLSFFVVSSIIPFMLILTLIYFVNGTSGSYDFKWKISTIIITFLSVIFIILAIFKGKSLMEAVETTDENNDEEKSDEDGDVEVKRSYEQLQSVISVFSGSSQEMLASANEVSNSIQQVAQGANDQSNDIIKIVENLTSLSKETDIVQEKLLVVKKNTNETETKAVEGEEKIYELIDFIVKIKGAFDVVSENINNLSATVSEIGKITDVINAISEQTNLLALNASIEAARAGEQGKGFSVVAEEVRKLAEESKVSSKKIINLVKSISQGTEKVIDNSGKVGILLEDQAVIANDSIISFEDIIGSVKSIPVLIKETEESLNKVSQNNISVLGMVKNVSEVAEVTSAASEEISASCEDLLSSCEEISGLSVKLEKEVEDLKNKKAY